MDIFHIDEKQVSLNSPDVSSSGFLWLDATHDEVAANPEKWRDDVARLTGTYLYDLHLRDALNLTHPSYFDATQEYEMVVFRKLALHVDTTPASEADGTRKKIPAALNKLATLPVSFFLVGSALITVRSTKSQSIEATRARLLNYKQKADGNSHSTRLPASPEDLMLRLLNSMVDQYLELRQPLTQQLDRWQHALLDPRKPFKNWLALLDSRIELRKLDHLCEEQHDALQELRDHIVDTQDKNNGDNGRAKDLLLVRTNDVIEHIGRVLNHARRLEASLESAVQIHFAAMAHRTSEVMRTLTVITALFMPLTLITGIFGMNFVKMPMLDNTQGFWIVIGAMTGLVIVLLGYFRSKRYLDDKASLGRD
ncbi:MAG: magnesium transporter CorA family protein [Undibacterium sp.]|jgi:magnesium transporter|nr:magnesium transporter CorA family protein [Undibacterium sp.]MDO8702382.1 magnesium transporter CorA family protein [Undibacterium sp.]